MNKPGNLRVEQSGPRCLVVGLGSLKLQHLGFPQGGAADEHAFLWANKLLKNEAHSAAIEISFGPSCFYFNRQTKIAVTGAAPSFTVNDKPYQSWQSCEVKAGDRLRLDTPPSGVFTYLALAGGLSNNNPSVTTTVKKGDCLSYEAMGENTRAAYTARTPPEFVPNYSEDLQMGVIVEKNSPHFRPQILEDFFHQSHTVSPNSNRMALLLEPNKTLSVPPINFYSQGLPFGAIQLPPSGKAILSLKDRQSIGGYPVLGYVSHLDCFRASQARPGQRLRFYRQDLHQAQSALTNFYRFFMSEKSFSATQ